MIKFYMKKSAVTDGLCGLTAGEQRMAIADRLGVPISKAE